MSLLVVGISHHKADAATLERVALSEQGRRELGHRILEGSSVNETVVLSTCNRTEVYADAATFHGAIADIMGALEELTGNAKEDLVERVYVHYEDRAIAHAFTVAGGLDSMAVGEAQILGQFRDALKQAQAWDHLGPALHRLGQQALRVGKRIHSETKIDSVSVSLVEAALTLASNDVGDVAESRVLVVGAGGMASLAAKTSLRLGAREVTIVNRTFARAEQLASRLGASARPNTELGDALNRADIVLACTGATGLVLTREHAARAMQDRVDRPLVLVDLALPHDVDVEVDQVPGVLRIGLDDLRTALSGDVTLPEVEAATHLVTGEVAAFITARAADDVAPTVAALRSRAADVVTAELSRLDQRVPELTDSQRAEVGRAVHRIVEKLLHTPTVRVKQLAADDSGRMYAEALRELFELDPHLTASVSAPPVDGSIV